MPNVSESDFLIRVDGISGYWSTMTGGDVTADTSQVYNGGDDYPTTIVAKRKISDVVVSRPFKPERDQDLLHSLRRLVGRFETTLSGQPTAADQVVSTPTVYTGAKLTSVKGPEANAGSSASAMLELTFAPNSVV